MPFDFQIAGLDESARGLFTTDVLVKVPLDESNPESFQWETTRPLNYRHPITGKDYVVEEKFRSDLASVRRVPIAWLFFGATANAAAILHDWLYRHGMHYKQIKDRLEADGCFYYAGYDTRVPAWRVEAMYRAIRIGGEPNFKNG